MKKAIVIASFGCSIKDSREKYIETIENRIKKRHNDIDCFRVFTSEIIRRKMKREENIDTDNMKTCLEKLKENGYTHVYVAVTHVIPGIEYEKITRACNEYESDFEAVKISRTFLDTNMGSTEVDVIKSYVNTDIQNDQAIVLVGHGTDHVSHKYYKEFEKLLKKDIPNLYIVNIEGNPFIEDITDELKEKKIRKIDLLPFLIVAGDHALNDIASDEEDSIKSKIIESGFEVRAFITGLGANESTIDLFENRLKEII